MDESDSSGTSGVPLELNPGHHMFRVCSLFLKCMLMSDVQVYSWQIVQYSFYPTLPNPNIPMARPTPDPRPGSCNSFQSAPSLSFVFPPISNREFRAPVRIMLNGMCLA